MKRERTKFAVLPQAEKELKMLGYRRASVPVTSPSDLKKDAAVVLAMPVDAAPVVCPGSAIDVCSWCGSRVWLAPSSQELVRTSGAKVQCARCIPEDVLADIKHLSNQQKN